MEANDLDQSHGFESLASPTSLASSESPEIPLSGKAASKRTKAADIALTMRSGIRRNFSFDRLNRMASADELSP